MDTVLNFKDYGVIGLVLAVLCPVIALLYQEGRVQSAGRLTDQKELARIIANTNDVLAALTASTNARTESANKATDAQIAAMNFASKAVESIGALSIRIESLEQDIRRFRDFLISKGMPLS